MRDRHVTVFPKHFEECEAQPCVAFSLYLSTKPVLTSVTDSSSLFPWACPETTYCRSWRVWMVGTQSCRSSGCSTAPPSVPGKMRRVPNTTTFEAREESMETPDACQPVPKSSGTTALGSLNSAWWRGARKNCSPTGDESDVEPVGGEGEGVGWHFGGCLRWRTQHVRATVCRRATSKQNFLFHVASHHDLSPLVGKRKIHCWRTCCRCKGPLILFGQKDPSSARLSAWIPSLRDGKCRSRTKAMPMLTGKPFPTMWLRLRRRFDSHICRPSEPCRPEHRDFHNFLHVLLASLLEARVAVTIGGISPNGVMVLPWSTSHQFSDFSIAHATCLAQANYGAHSQDFCPDHYPGHVPKMTGHTRTSAGTLINERAQPSEISGHRPSPKQQLAHLPSIMGAPPKVTWHCPDITGALSEITATPSPLPAHSRAQRNVQQIGTQPLQVCTSLSSCRGIFLLSCTFWVGPGFHTHDSTNSLTVLCLFWTGHCGPRLRHSSP